jgi:predicted HicB family RNase H-like nuclease
MTDPKRRGRPRVDPDDESVPLQIRVPARDYNASVEAARRERMSVGDWIRQRIRAANAPGKKLD